MLVGDVVAKMGLDSAQYVKELNNLERDAQRRGRNIGAALGKAIGAFLGIGLGALVKDILQVSAKTETLNVAMMAVARATGQSAVAIDKQKKAVMALGVAEQEATQIMTRFMQANLNTADALKVVRVAQDAGTIAGMNSSDAANQMVDAISKLSPRLLMAFGFTRNLNDIYGDYAKTVGKTSQQLTETQKKQAMVNYILAEGEKITGSYEAAMGTFGKKLGSIEKLSLPKKLMQELKTSFGAPLILPGAGVVLDNIIAQLSSLKNWALANEVALKRMGQNISNSLQSISRAISTMVKAIGKYWQTIKTVIIALTIYVTTMKVAALTTKAYAAILAAMSGTLATQIPILSFVSNAMAIYRAQMAATAIQGGILTRVLGGLRVALYAVSAALGPIGWAVLAISGVLAVGIGMWNKYNKSLSKTPSVGSDFGEFKQLDEAMRSGAGSTKEYTQASEDQAEALEKAGKAAKKSLSSFDEINQLSNADAGGAGGLGDLEVPDYGEVPDLDFGGGIGDMGYDELPPLKERLAGFWDWLKIEGANAWDKVKLAGANAWEVIKEKWGGMSPLGQTISAVILSGIVAAFTALGIRALVTAGQVVLSWAMQAAAAVAGVAKTIAGLVIMIARWAWAGVQALIHAGRMAAAWFIALGPIGWVIATVIALAILIIANWDWVKEKTLQIWSAISTWVAETWNKLKKWAVETWADLKKSISDGWSNIKKKTEEAWNNITKAISDGWGNIKKKTEESWKAMVSWLTNTWEGMKAIVVTKWDGMKNAIEGAWNSVRTTGETIWNTIKSSLSTVWDNILSKARTTFDTTKQTILDAFDDVKKRIGGIWEGIWTTIKTYINKIIDGFNSMIRGMNKLSFSAPDWAPEPLAGKTWGVNIPTIPKLESGTNLVPRDMIAFLHKGEAVVPREYNPAEGFLDTNALAEKLAGAFKQLQPSMAGDIYVYIGNEQVDAYIQKSSDRRNIRSNGR